VIAVKRIKTVVDRKLVVKTSNGVYSNNQSNRSSLQITWASTSTPKSAVAIGINPSKANNSRSDKTITTLSRFLDAYGFTELTMLNLFQSYSTPQSGIITSTATNFNNYKDMFDKADAIIIVWGIGRKYAKEKKNALQVLQNYKDKLYCISKGDKSPLHPSRMSYECSLNKFIL